MIPISYKPPNNPPLWFLWVYRYQHTWTSPPQRTPPISFWTPRDDGFVSPGLLENPKPPLDPIATSLATNTAWHSWHGDSVDPVIFLSHISQLYFLLPSHYWLSSLLTWVMSTPQYVLTYFPRMMFINISPRSLSYMNIPSSKALKVLLHVVKSKCWAHKFSLILL